MSLFSSADSAPEPERLVAYLDHVARAGTRMKHYAMAAHASREPDGPVLDLGCGAGHDLALLTRERPSPRRAAHRLRAGLARVSCAQWAR